MGKMWDGQRVALVSIVTRQWIGRPGFADSARLIYSIASADEPNSRMIEIAGRDRGSNIQRLLEEFGWL